MSSAAVEHRLPLHPLLCHAGPAAQHLAHPTTSAVRMLMLSSQERHEQHLEREQTRAQKMLKMQETLQLSDSEVMDHVQFARQVPCEVHCRVHATVHATVHAMLRSIVRQVRYAHFHWWV